MRRIRVIPVLLIQKGGLVKTVKFTNSKYIGDPINAVKIFNEKEIDEIIILDISATKEKRSPNIKQIKELAGECFMPLAYGGGITTTEQIKEILGAGVEKVVLNTTAVANPKVITEAALQFGTQSIVISIDVKKNFFGKYRLCTNNGTKNVDYEPAMFAKKMEEAGAGELMVSAIDRDGTYTGYDLELIKNVSQAVNIPVIACGGARNIDDLADAIKHGGASAVAAGSLFVYHGPHKAVLINFPSQATLEKDIYSVI